MGGEPTLSPFLNDAVEMLHSQGHTVSLTTNGVRTVEYWKNLAPKVNNVSFSYHPSYGIDNLYEKIEVISRYTAICVRVMFDSRHWDHAVEVYNKLLAIPYIRVDAVRILSEIAGGHTIGSDYTPEQLEWLAAQTARVADPEHAQKIKQNNPSWRPLEINSTFYYDNGTVDHYGDANNLISTEQTFFKGWACGIGLESIYINWDGQVRKGACRQGLDLFHLNNHADHALPAVGETCAINRCTCPTDILITKFPLNPVSMEKPRPVFTLVQQ